MGVVAGHTGLPLPPMPKKPKDPLLIAFGDHLRDFRYGAEMTQEDLAAAAGLHWTYIGQIERGERNLTYLNVLRLARGLGLTPAELLDGVEF